MNAASAILTAAVADHSGWLLLDQAPAGHQDRQGGRLWYASMASLTTGDRSSKMKDHDLSAEELARAGKVYRAIIPALAVRLKDWGQQHGGTDGQL
jgi:hypothetical protein